MQVILSYTGENDFFFFLYAVEKQIVALEEEKTVAISVSFVLQWRRIS